MLHGSLVELRHLLAPESKLRVVLRDLIRCQAFVKRVVSHPRRDQLQHLAIVYQINQLWPVFLSDSVQILFIRSQVLQLVPHSIRADVLRLARLDEAAVALV